MGDGRGLAPRMLSWAVAAPERMLCGSMRASMGWTLRVRPAGWWYAIGMSLRQGSHQRTRVPHLRTRTSEISEFTSLPVGVLGGQMLARLMHKAASTRWFVWI